MTRVYWALQNTVTTNILHAEGCEFLRADTGESFSQWLKDRRGRRAMSTDHEDPDMLPAGCGYQGYEFGAAYPDSICCGGRLYDADDCDSHGNLYEPSEDIPCPMCHPRKAVQFWAERFELGGQEKVKAEITAKVLVDDIRRNRKNGTEPWKAGKR